MSKRESKKTTREARLRQVSADLFEAVLDVIRLQGSDWLDADETERIVSNAEAAMARARKAGVGRNVTRRGLDTH